VGYGSFGRDNSVGGVLLFIGPMKTSVIRVVPAVPKLKDEN